MGTGTARAKLGNSRAWRQSAQGNSEPKTRVGASNQGTLDWVPQAAPHPLSRAVTAWVGAGSEAPRLRDKTKVTTCCYIHSPLPPPFPPSPTKSKDSAFTTTPRPRSGASSLLPAMFSPEAKRENKGPGLGAGGGDRAAAPPRARRRESRILAPLRDLSRCALASPACCKPTTRRSAEGLVPSHAQAELQHCQCARGGALPGTRVQIRHPPSRTRSPRHRWSGARHSGIG